jgi:hypothetical protein
VQEILRFKHAAPPRLCAINRYDQASTLGDVSIDRQGSSAARDLPLERQHPSGHRA